MWYRDNIVTQLKENKVNILRDFLTTIGFALEISN